uniref:Uncharacterized protein n=1 Tax=Rhizophora mucronata TaxID=61149 RepID=A0A2P2P3Y5_RHIMU
MKRTDQKFNLSFFFFMIQKVFLLQKLKTKDTHKIKTVVIKKCYGRCNCKIWHMYTKSQAGSAHTK